MRTIKGTIFKLILVFGIGIVITTASLFESYYLIAEKYNKLEKNINEIKRLKNNINSDFHSYIEEDVISEHYFLTRKSERIKNLNENASKLLVTLFSLKTSKPSYQSAFSDSIISEELKQLSQINYMQAVLLNRGYLESGYEGKMREYAHTLEKKTKKIGLVNLLQLRRHEKDFIIRQETRYVTAFNELANSIYADLKASSSEKSTQQELKAYQFYFNKVVEADKLLGFKLSTGVKKNYNASVSKQLAIISNFEFALFEQKVSSYKFIRYLYIVLFIGLFIACVIAARHLSSKISTPIIDLDKEISKLIAGKFSKKHGLHVISKERELASLTENIIIMETLLIDQLNLLKQNKRDMDLLFTVTSNDISTPLRKIDYLLNELKSRCHDPFLFSELVVASSEISNLSTVTEDLRLLLGLKSQDLQPQEINFEVLFKSIRNNLGSYPWFNDIVFSTYINSHQNVKVSLHHLRTIFQNLIEYAVLNANADKKTSFIKISVCDEEDKYISVTIEDNAISMTEAEAASIFDYPPQTKNNKNSFSLYLVKATLARIGAEINLQNNLSSGNKFIVRIPISEHALTASNLVA